MMGATPEGHHALRRGGAPLLISPWKVWGQV